MRYIFEQRGFAAMMLIKVGLHYTCMFTYSRFWRLIFTWIIFFRCRGFLSNPGTCVSAKKCLIPLSAKMSPQGVFVEVI